MASIMPRKVCVTDELVSASRKLHELYRNTCDEFASRLEKSSPNGLNALVIFISKFGIYVHDRETGHRVASPSVAEVSQKVVDHCNFLDYELIEMVEAGGYLERALGQNSLSQYRYEVERFKDRVDVKALEESLRHAMETNESDVLRSGVIVPVEVYQHYGSITHNIIEQLLQCLRTSEKKVSASFQYAFPQEQSVSRKFKELYQEKKEEAITLGEEVSMSKKISLSKTQELEDVKEFKKEPQSTTKEEPIDGCVAVKEELQDQLIKKLDELKNEIQMLTRTKTTGGILSSTVVAGEKSVHINGGGPCVIDWREYGFLLHIQEGSLAASTSCEIAIRAIVGGSFVFPEGVEPVSAVYAVAVSEELLKPAKLELQHCVKLDSEQQAQYLSFASAAVSPSLEFKLINGGVFPVGERYGYIQQQRFSFKTIVKRRRRICQRERKRKLVVKGKSSNKKVDNRETVQSTALLQKAQQTFPVHQEDPDSNSDSDQDIGLTSQTFSSSSKEIPVPDNLYSGQLYYVPQSINNWLMRFLVGQDLNALIKFMESENSHAEKDLCVVFHFDDSNCMELDLKNEDHHKGWSIIPQKYPCKISKSDADVFDSVRRMPPMDCLVQVCAEDSPGTAKRLSYPVSLKGIKSDTETIRISRELQNWGQSTGSQHQTASQPPPVSEESTENLVRRVRKIIHSNYSNLKNLIESRSIKAFAEEMHQEGLIIRSHVTCPTYDRIMQEYLSTLPFITDYVTVKCHFMKLVSILNGWGGGFAVAAEKLKQDVLYRL